ncbi:uncharacterized protein LOC126838861 [Adelges cooleyi]|uniref:uncharacterized protein LOC126838861 n=1 Tax=Adelges cooleyi TaxID=133065 RepID=UPI00217F4FB7|nr:uncharacterized protein LOC126838861 [Adelges cooleyi]
MNIKYMFFFLCFAINYSVIQSGKVTVDDIEDLKAIDISFNSALSHFGYPQGGTLTTAEVLEVVNKENAEILYKYGQDNNLSPTDLNNINEVHYKGFLEYIAKQKQKDMASSSLTELKL